MKRKINRRRIFIAMTLLQIFTLGILFFITYGFIKYKHENPPITEHINKSYVEDSSVIGLVSHWEFENILAGNKLADKSGNENTGILKSSINLHFIKRVAQNSFNYHYILGLPRIVSGKIGNSIEINGRQWISGGNHKAYNTNTFTVSAWVWNENDDRNWAPTIIAKGSWPFYDGWWLCTKNNTRYVDMGIAWGESYEHIESGYELPLREWHHIAVSMNNKSHQVMFFVDGLPYGKMHENVHEWLVNWSHDLFVGDYDGSGRWPWYGRLDDVRYFDRILSDEEILAVYNFKDVK